MRILLVSTQDYVHHPIPSRHHYIFEELAKRHEVHVPHFHVSRGKERETRLMFDLKDWFSDSATAYYKNIKYFLSI